MSISVKTLPGADVLSSSAAIQHARWEPYTNNGGTAVAIAGKDFCVVAADTRMSEGYSIQCRDVSKLHKLTENCVIGSSGMQADIATLRKVLDIQVAIYRQEHRKEMSTQSLAQLLSNILYGRRFFPYYAFNLLAGLDEDGKGAVYGYDAVGSYERLQYGVEGSGSSLITSILDNQVAFKTQLQNKVDLTIEQTVNLIKDVLTCAGERDIYTGDSVDIMVITSEGTTSERFELKRD